MNSLVKTVFFMLAFTITAQAQAANSWTVTASVGRYYPVGGHIIYVHLNLPELHNPAGCEGKYYHALSSDHPEFAEYKKLILTAMSTGLRLRLAISKESGDCLGASPKINAMYIQE